MRLNRTPSGEGIVLLVRAFRARIRPAWARRGAPRREDGKGNPGLNVPSLYCSQDSTNAQFGNPAPGNAYCAAANPYSSNGANSGTTKTFAQEFSGSPNGTWTLYVWTTKGVVDSAATIAGWSLTLTTETAAVNTTTTLSSNATNNETTTGEPVTLTATVSSTSTVNEGTVDFKDGGNTISNCGSVPVSSGTATCTTSYSANSSTEGSHSMSAVYSGNMNFETSSGSLSLFVDYPTTNPSAGEYCDTGTISFSGGAATPYPQHITIASLSGSLTDVSLVLPDINGGPADGLNFLLVDPAGHAFVPMAATGGSSAATGVTFTLSDYASSLVPNPAGAAAPGTYLPTDLANNPTFPNPAPSGGYELAPTMGSSTFESTFGGAVGAGQWSLYVTETTGGSPTIGGYCLNVTTTATPATTTTLSSVPAGAATTGQSVTLTATVTTGNNNAALTSGTVVFKDGGVTVSGPTALNGSGQATFTTTTLAEGIHNLTAAYSGVTGTYNVSSGSETIEVDSPTTNPSPGVYCNAGGINVPGTATGSNIAATPYPSRINVTGMSGTVKDVTLNLNSFTDAAPDNTAVLLVGPTSTNIVPFNDVGGSNAVNNANLVLADGGASLTTVLLSGTYEPTSAGTASFPSPAPTALSYAEPQGTQTFGSAFNGINPNGYWDVYAYNRSSGSAASVGSWCLNITTNPPVLSVTKTHTGTLTQGDASDTYTITVSNTGQVATNGTLSLVDTLPTGLTAVSFAETANTGGGTGSDWSCSGTSCTRTTAMSAGETDTLTLDVSVGYNAPTATNAVTNSVTVSGGGASTVSASDKTTVQPGPGYVLTLNASPSSGGSVAANPTNSTGMAAGHYVPGTNVSLLATANAGYAFASWTGSADVTNTTASSSTIVMNSAAENVTANFVVAYTDVTSSVAVSATGLLYNKIKKQGTETVTLTNTSGATIAGPIQLVLNGLPAGVTAANNTGMFNGNSYWTVSAGALAPGQSVEVTVTFSYAAGTSFTTAAQVFSGSV